MIEYFTTFNEVFIAGLVFWVIAEGITSLFSKQWLNCFFKRPVLTTSAVVLASVLFCAISVWYSVEGFTSFAFWSTGIYVLTLKPAMKKRLRMLQTASEMINEMSEEEQKELLRRTFVLPK